MKSRKFIALILSLCMLLSIGITVSAGGLLPLPEDTSLNIPWYGDNGSGIAQAGYYKVADTVTGTTKDGINVSYQVVLEVYYTGDAGNPYYDPQYAILCLGDDGKSYHPGDADIGGNSVADVKAQMDRTFSFMTKDEIEELFSVNLMEDYYGVSGMLLGWRVLDDDPDTPSDEHNFVYKIIREPSRFTDGLEGEVCTHCGQTRNEHKISKIEYIMKQVWEEADKPASDGKTVFECGELNSFSQKFMEKLAAKNDITYVFNYIWNDNEYSVTIPAGTVIDVSCDWYGPAKMLELYGMY